MYRLPDEADGTRPTKDLEWFFDCLEGTVRKCPGGDGCKKTLTLASILVHLNDDTSLVARTDCDVARSAQVS